MIADRLTVNGVDVKTLCRNVETLSATLRIPAKRTQNEEAAGRHGDLYVSRKKYNSGHLIWPMWLIGAQDNGEIPSGSDARKEFSKRVDELVNLMTGDESDLLEIIHYLPDGTARVIYGEVVDSIDFTTRGENPLGKVLFDIQTPNPFWTEQNQHVKIVEMGHGWIPETIYTFDELTGGNAPIEDAIVEFWNPTNPTILRSGPRQEVSFSVDGTTLQSDVAVRVDSGSSIIQTGNFDRLELRRNRATNPSAESSTTGYAHNGGGGGTISRVTSGYCPHGASFGQTTVTSASAINMRLQPFSQAQFATAGYVVGQTYTWSVYYRLRVGSTSASRQFRLRVIFHTDIGAISTSESALSSINRAADDTSYSAWTRFSVSAAVPSGCTRVEVLMVTDTPAVGDLPNWDALLIERAGSVGTYFDGGCYASAWDGSPNETVSARYVYFRQNTHTNPSAESSVTGYANNGGVGGTIAAFAGGFTYGGSKWVKVAATGSGSVTVFLMPFSDSEFHKSYEPGMSFTWSMYVRYMDGPGASRSFTMLADAWSGSSFLQSFSTSAVVVTKATLLDQASWTRLSLTATIPSNTTRMGMYINVPSCVSGDSIHFDAMMVEPGSVLNAYGDGDTTGWRWDSTVDNGPSGLYEYTGPQNYAEVTNYLPYLPIGDSRFVYLAPDANSLYRFTIGGSVATDTLNDSKIIIRANRKFKTG